jgi:hypothetical protein
VRCKTPQLLGVVGVAILAESRAVVTGTQVDQPIGIGRFAGEAVEGGIGADGGIALSVGGVTGGPEDGSGVIQDAADAAETVCRVPVPLGGVVALGVDSVAEIGVRLCTTRRRISVVSGLVLDLKFTLI